jgi:hypothetical protein
MGGPAVLHPQAPHQLLQLQQQLQPQLQLAQHQPMQARL